MTFDIFFRKKEKIQLPVFPNPEKEETVAEILSDIRTNVGLGIVFGLIMYFMISGGMIGMLSVIGFTLNGLYEIINYGILGNERPDPPVIGVPTIRMNECDGENRYTCLQMERLANIMETNLDPEVKRELDMKLYFKYGIEPEQELTDEMKEHYENKFYPQPETETKSNTMMLDYGKCNNGSYGTGCA